MKFLANENFPFSSFNFLLDQGCNILHVASSMSGINDEDVMNYSIKEDRVIITFDSDYGELVFKKGYKPHGVIYLRLQNFLPDFPGKLILSLLNNEDLNFSGYFTVVDENQIRQRKI